MDALENLEHFAAHGGLLMAPSDLKALDSVLSELRAAREAVEEFKLDGLYPHYPVRVIAQKMKEAGKDVD